MRLGRALRIGQVGVLAICLCAPLLLFGIGKRSGAIDNRVPTPRPAISGTKLLDTTVTAQFDEFLNDSFPLREQAVRANAKFAEMLGDSSNAEVEIGLDGWLFLASTREHPCIGADAEAALLDVLERIDRIARAVDTPITHVIAPDKATIFDDRMTSEPECALANAEVFAALGTTADVVSAWDATRAVADVDDTAYRRLDTHWTSTGAAPTAAAIVNRFTPGIWQDDTLRVLSSGEAQGDLNLLLGKTDTEFETILRSVPADAPSVSTPLTLSGASSESFVTSESAAHVTDWPDAIHGDVVILHDSFGQRLVPLVAPYFADVLTVREISPDAVVVHELLHDADHIVRQQIQREFYFDLVVNDLAAQFVVAFEREFEAFEVSCSDVCSIAGESVPAGDRYALATLRPGTAEAEIFVDGAVHELSSSTPTIGVFLDPDTPHTLTGDLDRVEWIGRVVSE